MLPEKFKKKRKFQTIPMQIEDTKPYVSANIVFENGTTLSAKMLMDSGASHGLLLEPTSDSSIVVPEHTVSSIIGRGLGGEITGKVGRIKSIDIGSFKLNNAIANFPDLNSYTDSLKVGSVFRNGAIGGEVLSRFKVIYNFPKEEVYLKKNSAFKKGFYYNLSGLTLKAKGAKLNIIEITEVREQSTAEVAGILAGDIIVAINGTKVSDLDLNLVSGMLSTKPGKRVVLEISRLGERMKKQFRLEDQL